MRYKPKTKNIVKLKKYINGLGKNLRIDLVGKPNN